MRLNLLLLSRQLFVYLIAAFILLQIGHISAVSPKQSAAKLPVQLAEVFNEQAVDAYLVSEKYDGVRAIWRDGQLRTRTGNLIHAPNWFIKDFPNIWLDGELWYARGDFEYVASTVSKVLPVDSEWMNIRYMVFDAPHPHMQFRDRVRVYTNLVNTLPLPHFKAVEQFSVSDNEALSAALTRYTQQGAEGLMLQKADALFSDGRSGNLLKLKAYMDAEAKVIAHLPGKGKYKYSLGALLVEYTRVSGDIIRFKIGTGFSDEERDNPPLIGSTITFKYYGFTKRGVPRFASYMRVYR